MKVIAKSVLVASIMTALIASTTIGLAQDFHTSVSRPASSFVFGPTGVKTDVGELKAAGAYGDFSKGKHGTFIKMPSHFVSPLHTHTEDYFGVVVQGIGVNSQAGQADVQLPAGSYWLQKGKEKHITKCISDTDCLFFIYQPGKFDYLPVKQ